MVAHLTLGPVVAVLTGAFLVVTGVKQRQLAARMQAWPSAAGTVSRSAVVQTRGQTSGRVMLYAPDVWYDYTVDGRQYQGQSLGFVTRSELQRGYAEGVVAEYPVGRVVTVYYDPAAPSESILDRASAPRWAAAVLWIGVAIAVAGLAWPWLVHPAA